jgi:coenzyme PQQ precursor peptide PqqA
LKAASSSQLVYPDSDRDPSSFFCMRLQCLRRSKMRYAMEQPQILLANFPARSNLTGGRIRPVSKKGAPKMAWKAPKIVEVPCGMEINMYVSATRK